MEQLNKQNLIEKKQWETPKAEVISNDIVKAGTTTGNHEGAVHGAYIYHS